MLFLMYWELNKNISVKERLKAADMWFHITSDNLGVILVDANSAEDVSNLNNM
ncbi:hypothetical protein [Pseudoalteromonas sp. C2R02]|uniref:hypothetical protein n=1 Tax=Pseudoalteromonas sp. C2R02 TaxID=2841565 RepID=UPI002090AA40|nr:hypothetical protein [Pseudoalteromonas sp. C2R02]